VSPRLPLACATGPPVADPALARTNRTIAKSLVTLDIKPWDDETDMAALEAAVRSIEKPGLLWGLSKLVPIGFGIKKLQMSVVVEDELVSVDELQEEIAEFDDYVQVRPGVPFGFFFFSSATR
jgi:translation elongation factor EF-1beta